MKNYRYTLICLNGRTTRHKTYEAALRMQERLGVVGVSTILDVNGKRVASVHR